MKTYSSIAEWTQRQEAWARDFFTRHAIASDATHLDAFTGKETRVIHWRETGTIINAIRYELAGGLLIVTGDLGDAIYQWSDRISVAFLAGCNLDYFAQKCLASENGRGYRERCNDLARLEFADRMREIEADPEEYEQERNAVDAAGSFPCWEEDPHAYARTICDETGDAELAGIYCDFGMAPSLRCRAHLIGLKMIHALQEASATEAA